MKPLERIVCADYTKFRFLTANRGYQNPGHIKEMSDSILRHNVIRDVLVIRKNGYYFVVDGQHLFIALKQLQMPVWCRVAKPIDNKDLVDLMRRTNNINKRWELTDYANMNCYAGGETYSFILEKYEEYDKFIKIGSLIHIYSGSINVDKFKDGTFKTSNRRKGNIVAQHILDISALIPQQIGGRRVMQYCIEFVNDEEYNHRAFLKRLKIWVQMSNLQAFPPKKADVMELLNQINHTTL